MVEHTMDVSGWLRKQLEEASPDLLRAMVQEMAEALMGAEADALCGAGYGERSPERVNRRNGYRERDWDTRVGLDRARRAEAARGQLLPGLAAAAAPAGRAGVRVGDRRCLPRRRLDPAGGEAGAAARRRADEQEPGLQAGEVASTRSSRTSAPGRSTARPYAYVTFDALQVKCREGGRTVNVCVVHAVGVNHDGFRESLGLDVVTSEDGAAWLAFLRSLVARGLSGVRLVTSDAHPGLVDAIAATLPGAAWQRCRTHAMRNLLTRVPKSAQSFVATMVRTIFAQPDADTVHEQHRRIVDQLETRFPEAAALLDEAAPDLLAFTAFPKEHWRQLWSNNSLERLNKEIRRRTDVVGIFPNRAAVIRLVGAVLAEQNDEWAVASRRYMSVESIAKALADPVDEPEEVIAIAAAA